MVFICEGQSAAGSITSCRDVNNQVVFVLKGKPLNVWGFPPSRWGPVQILPAVRRMISSSEVRGRNPVTRSNFSTTGLRRRMSSKPGA